MTPYPVKGSSLPIPFHRLLRVVVIADQANPQVQQLVEHLRGEHFEVEATGSFERKRKSRSEFLCRTRGTVMPSGARSK